MAARPAPLAISTRGPIIGSRTSSRTRRPFPGKPRAHLEDFPFRVFSDTADNRSSLLRDFGWRGGSAGVFRRIFSDLTADGLSEDAVDVADTSGFNTSGS